MARRTQRSTTIDRLASAERKIVDKTKEQRSSGPILPKGKALFEGIPLEAIVVEALFPTLGHGALVVQRPGAVGAVLVNQGKLVDAFCSQNGRTISGQQALAAVKNLPQGSVISAYVLAPELVELLPWLLRGEVCYEDLRLEWIDWDGLLEDLSQREGTYVVEVETSQGRGVTSISNGTPVATYTDLHPEAGALSLLDELISLKAGSVRVRMQPRGVSGEVAESNGMPSTGVSEVKSPASSQSGGAQVAGRPMEQANLEANAQTSLVSGENAFQGAVSFPTNGDVLAVEGPTFPPEVEPPPPLLDLAGGGSGMTSAPVNPEGDSSVAVDNGEVSEVFVDNYAVAQNPTGATGNAEPLVVDYLAELKAVARSRLKRSALRVESLLDTAASEDRTVAEVADQVRTLPVRGVVQATMEQLADEMVLLASAQ